MRIPLVATILRKRFLGKFSLGPLKGETIAMFLIGLFGLRFQRRDFGDWGWAGPTLAWGSSVWVFLVISDRQHFRKIAGTLFVDFLGPDSVFVEVGIGCELVF